jgi:hypothetical protein
MSINIEKLVETLGRRAGVYYSDDFLRSSLVGFTSNSRLSIKLYKPVIKILLNFAIEEKNHPEFSNVLEALKSGGNEQVYGLYCEFWEETKDPDIFTLFPKGEYWELASILQSTAKLRKFSRYTVQIALSDLVNGKKTKVPFTITDGLVDVYISKKHADLRPELLPFVKICQYEVTKAWERTGNPLLEPLLEKNNY